jgi:hypothetical protein
VASRVALNGHANRPRRRHGGFGRKVRCGDGTSQRQSPAPALMFEAVLLFAPALDALQTKEVHRMKTDRDQQPRRFYSRPADESLAAYKEWINGMTVALGGTMEDDITEEEWERSWCEFWGKTDQSR